MALTKNLNLNLVKNRLSTIVLLLFFGLLPTWIQDPYIHHVIIEIAYFSIAALGVRLMLTAGYWNFGQAGFMTLGGYVAAMLTLKLNIPSLYLTLPMASVSAALLGCAFGYPALRVMGIYFAILTLTFSLLIRQIIVAFPDVTGGLYGIYDVTAPSALPFLGELGNWEKSKLFPYYLILVLLIFTCFIMNRIEKSRFGMILKSTAQGETLAQSVGISVLKYRLIAFTIGSFFGGLSGAFATHYHMLIHPDYYNMWISIYIVVYVIFGGASSIFGAILGTAALIGGMELLKFAAGWRAVIYAGIIICVTLFLPEGIVSLPEAMKRLMRRWRGQPRSEKNAFMNRV